MKPVYLVNASAPAAMIATIREHNPALADIMAAPGPMMALRFRTKRAADKWAAEWAELGYIVERKTMMRAESLEEAFMTIIGVPA